MDDIKSAMTAIPLGPGPAMMEIVELTARDDERVWIPDPSGSNVLFRPLMFDMANGNHVEIMKVAGPGNLGRHLHTTPVHGFVLEGSWRYLEHDWVAEPGAYVYEPAGEAHTLVTENPAGMTTFFHISGPILYVDESNAVVHVDTNQTLIDLARKHYAENGLGADFVDRLMR